MGPVRSRRQRGAERHTDTILSSRACNKCEVDHRVERTDYVDKGQYIPKTILRRSILNNAISSLARALSAIFKNREDYKLCDTHLHHLVFYALPD
jgi:hypothetical protein